jgi:beta-glucanase (GH16 family)
MWTNRKQVSNLQAGRRILMNRLLSGLYLQIFLFVPVFSGLANAQNWQLVWSDEFDGTIINESNWTHEIGGNGWGNNELQYYTDRDTNSYIENGYLVIQALKENYSSWNYTSARLKTQGKVFFKYGKILARMKLPYSQGIWPAFWMMGENISSVGWPACGETDIMELIGGENRDNTVYGTAHWADANGQHAQYGNSYTLSSGIFADNFHLFSVIWDEQSIKWYVDNHLYNELDITSATLSEFHNNFFILLNIAVGGVWPGYPDSTTVFPQKMYVDYIRVYQDMPSSVEEGRVLPEEYNLFQNYPNPFNPTTTIKYQLPEAGNVRIKVFDTLGKQVATLVNEEKSAGNYAVDFNAGDLSSGMYFYTLSTENSYRVKKMLLLK